MQVRIKGKQNKTFVLENMSPYGNCEKIGIKLITETHYYNLIALNFFPLKYEILFFTGEELRNKIFSQAQKI